MTASMQVRLCRRDGRMEIVQAGRYMANDPKFSVHEPISTAGQWLRLAPKTVSTKSSVALTVVGLLQFRIQNPEAFARAIDPPTIDQFKTVVEPLVDSIMRSEFQVPPPIFTR